VGNGNLVLLEDLQNTQMGKTPRKSSTKSEADAWPGGRARWTFVQCLLRGMGVLRHEQRMTSPVCFLYGPSVLKKQYDRTAMENFRKSLKRK
jgi:hypothetical protein